MRKYEDGKYIELSEEEVKLIEQESKEYIQKFTYDEAVNLKIRERYTESQEFSLLRQRDEKPEEFQKYYDYCEECKNCIKKSLVELGDIDVG